MSNFDDEDEYLYYQEPEEEEEEEVLVLIRTEDNSWSTTVSVDDQLFSDLIQPYTDLGEIPSEIVLRDTIGEVFKEQWRHYEAMIHYRHYIGTHHKGVLHQHETPEMTSLLEGWSRSPRLPSLIYLHQISAIANILNLPTDWEVYVGVDERSSVVDTKRHLVAMSHTLVLSPESYMGRYYGNQVAINTLRSIVNEMERYSVYGMINGDELRVHRGVVYAAMRNALLLTIDRGRGDYIDSSYIPWIPLLEYFKDKLPADNWSISILNTIAMFAGVGDYSSPAVGSVDLRLDDKSGVMISDERNLYETYDLFLLSVPTDIDPVLYGLGPIISTSRTIVPLKNNNSLFHMITWINYNTILHKQRQRGGVDYYRISRRFVEDDVVEASEFYSIAQLLATTTVGISGLIRIREILSNYMVNNKNLRAKRFIEEADRVISDISRWEDVRRKSKGYSKYRQLPQ